MKHIPYILFLFSLLLNTFTGHTQYIPEKIHQERIRTVQVRKIGDSLAPPVIHLNTAEKVKLCFDELEKEPQNYSYTLIHCDANWAASELMKHEYLYSQFEDEIPVRQNSFNTIIPYTHYEVTLPNEYIEPSISGNYTILVFKNHNPSDTVLTARFRISEAEVSVKPTIEHINRMSENKPNQKLNFSIHTGSTHIQNPYNSLKIEILQNGHNRRLIEHVNPASLNGQSLTYQNLDKLLFKGGNEFRSFNTKSKKFAGRNIEQFDFLQNQFHVRLSPDRELGYQQYKKKKEINGQYMIDKELTSKPELEADYMYVYFNLQDPTPDMEGGKVYVSGAFNNWKYGRENEMRYNFEEKAYQTRILLKQGYYDYKYVMVKDGKPDETTYSGNYYQTENQYEIYIYFRDFSNGYDRLLGTSIYHTPVVEY